MFMFHLALGNHVGSAEYSKTQGESMDFFGTTPKRSGILAG